MKDLPTVSTNLYFYPRPPRGGRHAWQHKYETGYKISIHALREEGDPLSNVRLAALVKFLSTPSARRATLPGVSGQAQRGEISIHALREEGDGTQSLTPF